MKIRTDLTDLARLFTRLNVKILVLKRLSELARHIELLPETFLVAEKDNQILAFSSLKVQCGTLPWTVSLSNGD